MMRLPTLRFEILPTFGAVVPQLARVIVVAPWVYPAVQSHTFASPFALLFPPAMQTRDTMPLQKVAGNCAELKFRKVWLAPIPRKVTLLTRLFTHHVIPVLRLNVPVPS